MNTLRNSRQNIHSIILVRKIFPTKELSQEQDRFGRRQVFKEHCRSRRKLGVATPESGSGLLSLLFGKKLAREENAVRRTKVTTIPERQNIELIRQRLREVEQFVRSSPDRCMEDAARRVPAVFG